MDLEPPSLFLITTFEPRILFSMVSLFVLLLCSALISGVEVAIFSLTKADLEIEETHASYRKVQLLNKLLRSPQKLLATILIANNLVNIAIVLLFASISNVLYADLDLVLLGVDVKFILEVGVATFLLLLFGEILPKIYASRNRLSFSLFMVYPLNVLNVLFAWLSTPMQWFTNFAKRRFGTEASELSVDRLSHALELTSEEDTSFEEQKLLQGIVTFGNIDAKQVMRPRMEVFAVDESLPYTEVLEKIIEMGYSRIPVYKENIDQISGVLYVKDLIPYIDAETLDWKSLIREAYFVPENKKLDDLLNDFKRLKIHLAVVVDEYGGTSGLITMEDVIEEIVGEISDEFDEDDVMFSKLDENNYVFEGKTTLKDFYEIIGQENMEEFENAKGESETLAGFLLEIYKGFPKKGDVIPFNNYLFTVEAFENRRIKQIKLSIEQE